MKNYQPPSNSYWLVFAIIALILFLLNLYVKHVVQRQEAPEVRAAREKGERLMQSINEAKARVDLVKEAIEADKKAPTPVVREKPITGEWDIIINAKDKK